VKGFPSVGVVVAARNAGAFIAAALSSVIDGVVSPNEIVVIDGGSTDDTVAVASSFAGVRVVAQRGEGLAAARNQGLGLLSTDLVAFCDADDRWTPDSLGDRLAYLAGDSGCAAVVGRMVTVALNDEPVPGAHVGLLGASRIGLTPGALLARADVFAHVGSFDTGLRIAADSEWFARLMRSTQRVERIDAVVLEKGVRRTSLSNDLDTYRRELLAVTRSHGEYRRARISI